MALVLYTELKYKRISCYDVSFLTYTGEINEENLPRVIPIETDDSQTKEEEKYVEDNSNVVFEVDVEYLKNLDPKNWKDQDHYAVLGLKSARYCYVIRFIYKKLLKHPTKITDSTHPMRTFAKLIERLC